MPKKQRKAIKHLRSIGWKQVIPFKRHYIIAASATGAGVTVWCAPALAAYFSGEAGDAISGCPKHVHSGGHIVARDV